MKFVKCLVVLSVILLTACTSKTEYGSCVGINEKQNPKLHYKVSAWNVTLGIVFVELVAPPVFVVLDETYCPVGPATDQ